MATGLGLKVIRVRENKDTHDISTTGILYSYRYQQSRREWLGVARFWERIAST